MSPRGTRVRSKIVALLVSLVALWAFAAYVTVQAGLNLLWINTLDEQVARPTDALITALQAERRLSVEYLSSGRTDPTHTLDEARTSTDSARAALEGSSSTTSVRWAGDEGVEERLATLRTVLEGLATTRAAVDVGGTADRSAVADRFTTIVTAAFGVFDQVRQSAVEAAEGGRAVVNLARAREVLSQEDALITGVLRSQTYAGDEPVAFTSIVAVQRAYYAEAAARLSTSDGAGYAAVTRGTAFGHLTELEDRGILLGRTGASPPFGKPEWRAAIDPVLAELRQVELTLTDVVLERARPAATGVWIRLILAGGLGLVAVVASIVVAFTTSRQLLGKLERLRGSAEELATRRLPLVVERLQQGERVDVATEAPPLQLGQGSIGRVAEAFNAVQHTAIQTAVDQADLRRGVRDVFLSLARRSQALLHRQLGLLDAMERRATDPDELAELFRVDHLATRMRRNAENLIVLSGASAGRAWRRPVPMIDVVRGALAEVEDYTRVTVTSVSGAALIGRAVGDVIHLLAELIENAVSFSPPQTVVRVGASLVGNGYAIEIEDRGLGMSAEELQTANEQLRNPPEFKLSSTARLGLYVVGKLAERHGIKVQLGESSFGGTTAVVLLPATLIADESGESDGEVEGFRPAQLAVIGAGRRSGSGTAGSQSAGSQSAAGKATSATTNAGVGGEVVAPRRSPEHGVVTPSGLPWRQKPTVPRSATNLGRAPNSDAAPTSDDEPYSDGAAEPEESTPSRGRGGVHGQLSSYQAEAARGRGDAARMTQPELEAPDWTAEAEGHADDAADR